jgi:predicted lipoprotein
MPRAEWRRRVLKTLLEEDLVDLARDRKLGLQLPDAPPGGRQIQRHIRTPARDLAAVNALLAQPVLDRRLAHPERRRQLRHLRPHTSELDYLPPNHGGIASRHKNPPGAEGL